MGTGLPFRKLKRTRLVEGKELPVNVIRLQLGVGDIVGEAVDVVVSVREGVVDGVKVSVGVNVSVGVGVSDGVRVGDGVFVSVGVCVRVGDGVSVGGTAMVAGRPSTRARRNCSTIASRRAVRCREGHQLLRMGAMSG
jgi:hypothetical protein